MKNPIRLYKSARSLEHGRLDSLRLVAKRITANDTDRLVLVALAVALWVAVVYQATH